MQPQQQQSQVGAMTSMTLSGQQGASTITTMAAHPQVQVIQQPVQNQYLPQLYNAQGTPILMPGNLIHPANINPSSIQVTTATKRNKKKTFSRSVLIYTQR